MDKNVIIILKEIEKSINDDLNWILKKQYNNLHFNLITSNIKIGNAALEHLKDYMGWNLENIDDNTINYLKSDLLICIGNADFNFI